MTITDYKGIPDEKAVFQNGKWKLLGLKLKEQARA